MTSVHVVRVSRGLEIGEARNKPLLLFLDLAPNVGPESTELPNKATELLCGDVVAI